MKALVQTIRFKTIAATGTCTALILVIGFFGTIAVNRLADNVSSAYSETTLPILDLENVRAAQIEARLGLRRIQALRDMSTVYADRKLSHL